MDKLISRRDFLKGTGATLGSLLLFSSSFGKSKTPSNGLESSSDEGWTKIWESDFEEGNLDCFSSAHVDQSVGCERFPPTEEDVLAHVVKEKTAPGGDYTLELVANPKNKGGTFVNAITTREIPFEDDHLYKVEGYFRKLPNTEPELLDMELQFINDSWEESYNSFLWYLNEYNDKGYEWVMVPTKEEDEFPYKKLFKLDEDSEWHKFEFIGRYESDPKSRKISKVIIDDKEAVVNEEVPIWKNPWRNLFQVLLETHNMYTNCNLSNHFVGKSRWDNIKVYKKPLS